MRVNLDLAAKIAPMGNKKLIGWSQDEGKLRFLLDASPLDDFGHRGWHVCNHEGY